MDALSLVQDSPAASDASAPGPPRRPRSSRKKAADAFPPKPVPACDACDPPSTAKRGADPGPKSSKHAGRTSLGASRQGSGSERDGKLSIWWPWAPPVVQGALKKGQIFRAKIRFNAYNREQAYATLPHLPSDVLIQVEVPAQDLRLLWLFCWCGCLFFVAGKEGCARWWEWFVRNESPPSRTHVPGLGVPGPRAGGRRGGAADSAAAPVGIQRQGRRHARSALRWATGRRPQGVARQWPCARRLR